MKNLVFLILLISLFISACNDSTDPSSNFGKIQIRVLNVQDLSPISGVLIKTNPPSQAIITDDNGKVLFINLEPGNYIISAAKIGFISNTTNINVIAGKIVQADIILADSTNPPSNLGKIKIRVLNVKDSKPLSGVLIKTEPSSESLVTNETGDCLIENLQPGSYKVNAEKLGFINNSTNVNVLSDKIVQADILLYDESFNNFLPEKPVLKTPENNSTINTLSTYLNWTCIDQNKDELAYKVYFDEVNPPTKIVASDFSEISCKIINLKHNTTYFWYIIPKDKYGEGPKSSVYSFVVDTTSEVVPPEDNLVLNIPFDGTYNDISKSNLSTYCSFPDFAIGRKGNAGGAFAFLNRNTITVSNNSAIDFINNFSVSFWIKPNLGYGFDMNIDNMAQIVGRFGASGANNSTYSINIMTNGHIDFQTHSPTYGTNDAYGNKSIPTNYWSHVCVIYTNAIVSIYINGELDKIFSVYPTQTSNYDLVVGGRPISNNRYFNGIMDDLKIFNKVLTNDEIMSLYNE
jgi:hypothetical protein